MRLDSYLAEKGFISSRSKSKRAIQLGFIRVDGKIITEPDHNIVLGQNIEITDPAAAELPEGFWKLSVLQERTNCIEKNDIVLDLGSSAGGYLLYASRIAAKVYGVEMAREFTPHLSKVLKECKNVEVKFGDIFRMPLKEVCPENVDVILNDLTLEPLISFTALERVLPLLKRSGRLLMTLKLQDMSSDEAENMARDACKRYKLEIKDFIGSENKKELFLFARKT